MRLRVKPDAPKVFVCSFHADHENRKDLKHLRVEKGGEFECPDAIAEGYLSKYKFLEKVDG